MTTKTVSVRAELSMEELRAVVGIRLQSIQGSDESFAPRFFAQMGQPEPLMRRAANHPTNVLGAVLKEWAASDATDREIERA